jgi:hypothetical protein
MADFSGVSESESRKHSADLLSEVKRLRTASEEAMQRFEEIQKRIADIERRLEDRPEPRNNAVRPDSSGR